MSTILGVVGVRNLRSEEYLPARNVVIGAVEEIKAATGKLPSLIVHNGSSGIAATAKQIAKEYGIEERSFVAKERKWDVPYGFKWSCEQVSSSCTVLLVIRTPGVQDGGVEWTASDARKNGKQVKSVTL